MNEQFTRVHVSHASLLCLYESSIGPAAAPAGTVPKNNAPAADTTRAMLSSMSTLSSRRGSSASKLVGVWNSPPRSVEELGVEELEVEELGVEEPDAACAWTMVLPNCCCATSL